jgi:hypothetical protein
LLFYIYLFWIQRLWENLFIDNAIKNYEKYTVYDNEDHKLDMRIIVSCPTILSTANPIYETLKYLDEEDFVMDYSDNNLLDKLDRIEKEKEDV